MEYNQLLVSKHQLNNLINNHFNNFPKQVLIQELCSEIHKISKNDFL